MKEGDVYWKEGVKKGSLLTSLDFRRGHLLEGGISKRLSVY